MYLLIDNSTDQQVVFHYYLDTKWVQADFSLDKISLIEALDGLLTKKKKTLKDLHGLAVVVGKGRFTATRVATTLANTLAYALVVPVLAVDSWYENLNNDLAAAPRGVYISAKYSAPANIGGQK